MFDGKTQFATLPPSIMSAVIDEFTISFWINPSTINGAHIFDFGYGDQSKYFFLSNGKTIEFNYATQGIVDNVKIDSGLTLTAGNVVSCCVDLDGY